MEIPSSYLVCIELILLKGYLLVHKLQSIHSFSHWWIFLSLSGFTPINRAAIHFFFLYVYLYIWYFSVQRQIPRGEMACTVKTWDWRGNSAKQNVLSGRGLWVIQRMTKMVRWTLEGLCHALNVVCALKMHIDSWNERVKGWLQNLFFSLWF